MKYLVIAGYFAVLLVIGAVASRRVQSISDYYVGGKRLDHAEFASDRQPVVEQGKSFFTVDRPIRVEQGLGIVMAGPAQLRPELGPAAECQGVLEVARRVRRAFERSRQQPENPVYRQEHSRISRAGVLREFRIHLGGRLPVVFDRRHKAQDNPSRDSAPWESELDWIASLSKRPGQPQEFPVPGVVTDDCCGSGGNHSNRVGVASRFLKSCDQLRSVIGFATGLGPYHLEET